MTPFFDSGKNLDKAPQRTQTRNDRRYVATLLPDRNRHKDGKK